MKHNYTMTLKQALTKEEIILNVTTHCYLMPQRLVEVVLSDGTFFTFPMDSYSMRLDKKYNDWKKKNP